MRILLVISAVVYALSFSGCKCENKQEAKEVKQEAASFQETKSNVSVDQLKKAEVTSDKKEEPKKEEPKKEEKKAEKKSNQTVSEVTNYKQEKEASEKINNMSDKTSDDIDNLDINAASKLRKAKKEKAKAQ